STGGRSATRSLRRGREYREGALPASGDKALSVGIGAAEATSDEDRARDALWEAGYDTFYNAYYQEILASTLAARWSRFDAVSRTRVRLASASSPVLGWALGNEPAFRWVWGLLEGVSPLLATIHAVIDVPGKLKLQGDLNRLFSALRIDLETYRSRMTFQPHF